MYKMISCLLAGLAGAAIVFAVPPGRENVQGRWSLVELASRPVHPSTSGSVPWFTIRSHAIEGYDGCNEFSGSLDKPGSIVATRRGCSDGALKLPLDLADPVPQLKAGKIIGNKLLLPKLGTMSSFVMRKVP